MAGRSSSAIWSWLWPSRVRRPASAMMIWNTLASAIPRSLYRGIEQGLDDLASQLGERVLFVGEPRAQATPDRFRYPQLIAVTGLASAHAAIDEIIEQDEGARGDWRPAHYGRFFSIWTEYQQLGKQDPSFEPARPVIPTRLNSSGTGSPTDTRPSYCGAPPAVDD
jgi:hypothetical protein